jgi:hypothetical protein
MTGAVQKVRYGNHRNLESLAETWGMTGFRTGLGRPGWNWRTAGNAGDNESDHTSEPVDLLHRDRVQASSQDEPINRPRAVPVLADLPTLP